MCGGSAEGCDEVCGGADCKSCGGGMENMETCIDGLVAKANKAHKLAKEGDDIAKEKRVESEKLVSEVGLFMLCISSCFS